MTLIVGMKDKDGTIWMGVDTLSTNGSSSFTRNDPKVFIKSGYLIGYTTSYRFGQIVRHHVKFPDKRKPKADKDYKHITGIVESIRKGVTEYGFATINNNRVSGGRLLIGWKHNLFMMDTDFQYSDPAMDYYAIGSGYELALGSLFTTDKCKKGIKDRLLVALRSGDMFDPGVKAPFIIMNTKCLNEVIK